MLKLVSGHKDCSRLTAHLHSTLHMSQLPMRPVHWISWRKDRQNKWKYTDWGKAFCRDAGDGTGHTLRRHAILCGEACDERGEWFQVVAHFGFKVDYSAMAIAKRNGDSTTTIRQFGSTKAQKG